MRLNLYLRGIDLIDVEFHCGSKGLYVDLSLFQPRQAEQVPDEGAKASTADLSSTSSGSYERVESPVWQDDQPALVRGFGFGGNSGRQAEQGHQEGQAAQGEQEGRP